MEQPPTLDTPESWGAASKGYAKHVAPLMMESFAAEFVDRLQADSAHEALEVAAGSGALTHALAPRVKSLLATDFSPEMIALLRERIEALGAEHVTCDVMDGQALALDDNRFDRSVCCFGLMLFPDRAAGFRELHRVTRPGGRTVVTGWAGPDKFEAFGLFLGAVKQAFPDMPPPPSPPPVLSLADLADFKVQMEAGGFREVEVDYVARELELPGVEEVWAMMTSGAPPVQMLLDRIGPEGKEKLHDKLAEIVDQRFGSGPVCVINTATVASGIVS